MLDSTPGARGAVLAGALLGGLGVALGAFGAHGLSGLLAERGTVATFETAVRYQQVHALALLLCGVLRCGTRAAALCFLAGTVVFSGSLYALALSGVKGFGAVTPVGGVLLIAGWGALAWRAWRSSGPDCGPRQQG